MGDTAIAYNRGGEHATARRSGLVEDIPFIQAKRRAGVPDSAIANMIGRSEAEVRQVGREEPPAERPKPIPLPPVSRQIVLLSLYKGLIRVESQEHHVGVMEETAREVAMLRDVSVEDLRGPRKTKAVAHARQELMWRLRDIKDGEGGHRFTTTQIGRFLGDRDHSTVLHGVAAHQARLDGGAK